MTSVELLQRDAQEYYTLAEASDFDYAKLLKDHREEVQTAIKELQGAHIQANPAYEEMEGVVAGVPSLADYDVIIDAGADESDPENAVPFSLETKAGKKFKQPGNFFALVETSVFGTEPKFPPRASSPTSTATARSRSPRRCRTPTSCSPPSTDFVKYAKELDAVGQEVGARRSRTPTRPSS